MKNLLLFSSLLLIGVGVFIGQFLSDAGAFQTIEPHFENGNCEQIKGIIGAEDLVFDQSNNHVYLTNMDFRALQIGKSTQGALFAYDLNTKSPPEKIQTDFSGPLNPHGISFYQGTTGRSRLFVVNHPTKESSTIEIFEVVRPTQFKHIRTVETPHMVSINDVAAVGPEQFYATNDGGNPNGTLLRTIETFARIPWSNVIYFDGNRSLRVADSFNYANGILLSQDKTLLYVAETTGRIINVFERNFESGELTFRKSYPIPSGLDNLSLDSQGDVWIAAHPKMLDFLAHAEDHEKLSASQVFRINVKQHTVDEIYLDDGSNISGSSTALPVGDNRFLIGSVFEPHFLDCSF